jgi:hydroxypyruvate isomerase
MNRRTVLKAFPIALLASESIKVRIQTAENQLETSIRGKINHAACRWCYSDIPLDELCQKGKNLGLMAIDLLKPDEWQIAKKYDLQSSMGLTIPSDDFLIKKGFNRLEYHNTLINYYESVIPQAAAAGVKNIICFSGNREGLSDEMGIANCSIGLKKIMQTAEKHGVTLCMELLNSKIDHKDYQCDKTEWGVALCKAVGSENFKLLYDIYHMQIMEGDVIRTIKDSQAYIAHYHTGGVPGRHEIDETQELNYPAIMKAIAETGFKGFVAQEFIPTYSNKLLSLEKCLNICTVI